MLAGMKAKREKRASELRRARLQREEVVAMHEAAAKKVAETAAELGLHLQKAKKQRIEEEGASSGPRGKEAEAEGGTEMREGDLVREWWKGAYQSQVGMEE